MERIDVEGLPVILNQEQIRDANQTIERKDNKLEVFQEVMQSLERFLTYWHENGTEFGKMKDTFNESDMPGEIRINSQGRVKVKIDTNES